MNETPTSGPIATSSTHHAREATSSRYSFATNHDKDETAEGAELAENNVLFAFSAFSAFSAVPSLCECKNHLFEIVACAAAAAARGRHGGQLLARAFAPCAAAAQQYEAIADARRVPNLMNRQEHRPAHGGVGAQRLRHLAALTQIEAVERLVGPQHRLRHQQPGPQQPSLTLPLRGAWQPGGAQWADSDALHRALS